MKKPNVIFILIDDLGWADLGCYGNNFTETPHIDNLADSGIRFTNAYASAPVCSPSRAGLLTGQAPPRNGITDYLRPQSEWFLPGGKDTHGFSDNELPEDTDYKISSKLETLAEMFKNSGYATGIIGKWHLSGYDKNGVKHGPEKYGFDEVLISEQRAIGSGSYFHPYNKVDSSIEPVLGENEFLVDRMNYEAVEYIKRHEKEPFFLYLSHYGVHTTLDAKEKDIEYFSKKRKHFEKNRSEMERDEEPSNEGNFMTTLATLMERLKPKSLKNFAKSKKQWKKQDNPVLAAMLKSIDEGVGEILKTLKKFRIDENTLIVFTSDNGGEHRVTTNGPLRGGKSFTYEGGLRVPQIISYPGVIEPSSITDIATINLDFYPTFAEIIGREVPKDHVLDGVSLFPFLKGERDGREFHKRVLSWHYPLRMPHFLGGRSSAANRKENFKFIWFFNKGTGELYNLEEDLSETTNLAQEDPKKLTEFRDLLKNWIRNVKGTIYKNQEGP